MPYMTPRERGMKTGGMGSMASMSPPGQLEPGAGGDAYSEDGPPAPAGDEMPTADVPMALLGGKEFKPGEEVMMKVVSLDPDNKTVKLAYATGKPGGGGMMDDENPAVAGMPGGEGE